MAENITIARPYARAAFDLADESGQLDAWSVALASAASAAEDPGFEALLGDPHVRPGQLADLLGDVVTFALGGHPGEIDLQAGNLFRIMSENRRLHVLSEVAGLFSDLKIRKREHSRCAAGVGNPCRGRAPEKVYDGPGKETGSQRALALSRSMIRSSAVR